MKIYSKKVAEFIKQNTPKPILVSYAEILEKAGKLIASGQIMTSDIVTSYSRLKSNNIFDKNEKIEIKYSEHEASINLTGRPRVISYTALYYYTRIPRYPYTDFVDYLISIFDINITSEERIILVPYDLKNGNDLLMPKNILCFLSEAQKYLNEYYKNASLEISKLIFEQVTNKVL